MDYYELLTPRPNDAQVSTFGVFLPDDRLRNEVKGLAERLNPTDFDTTFEIMKKRCKNLTNPRALMEFKLLRDSDLLFLKGLLAYGFGIFDL